MSKQAARAFNEWLPKLIEAHRLGLIDDCHELARVAAGLQHLARMNCDDDETWDHCFDEETGEFDEEMFQSTWRDIHCLSSSGRSDEILDTPNAWRVWRVHAVSAL